MPAFSKAPKAQLGFFPTPLIELSRLGRALNGPSIFMKRDDLTGLAFGGNKTRKLEYLLGDAIARGCDTVITAGAEQSNHCRQTAAAAAMLGLECHLVLGGDEPVIPTGNLLLDRLFNCTIHWAGAHRKGEDIPEIFTRLQAAGKTPCIIPYGGSNELGALAFVEAFDELVGQSRPNAFSHIIFASSSGGTQAGLMLGKQLHGDSCELVGINIDKDETGDRPFREQLLALTNKTAAVLELSHRFTDKELLLNDDYHGSGYGIVGEIEREAILLTAKTEGILLDPVYTGRAMAGLIDMIRCGVLGKDDRVLFWHTGGTPAIFAQPETLLPQK